MTNEDDPPFPIGILVAVENTEQGFNIKYCPELTKEDVAAILYGTALRLLEANNIKVTLQ